MDIPADPPALLVILPTQPQRKKNRKGQRVPYKLKSWGWSPRQIRPRRSLPRNSVSIQTLYLALLPGPVSAKMNGGGRWGEEDRVL